MRTWLTQRILLPAVQSALRNGAWDCYTELNETQWSSPQRILAHQHEKLSQLLRHAYATVPLYRRAFDGAGLVPDDVKRPEDLALLPIQTKASLREGHPHDTVSRTALAADRIANSTSGSTGSPFEFTMSRRLMGMRWGRYLRGQTWTGMRLGDRYVRLWGPHGRPPLERAAIAFTLNMTELSAFGMDPARMLSYVNLIRQRRPRIIEAYASAAAGLAVFMNQNGLADVHVDAVITSGETLFAAHRAAIEQAFHCPVFNRYGCREFGGIAHECAAHHGLHVNAESFVVEFIEDERTVRTGLRRIVLTNLDNLTMPFIRYDIGDIGRPGTAPCSCGRGLPVIEAPFGRMIDLVFSPSGRMISVHFLTLLFGDYSRYVSGFQAIQTAPDRLDVLFVPTGRLTPMIEKELHARLLEHAGEDMQVVLEPVAELPEGDNGKRALLRSGPRC
jgi:phenylacetate-CoA ligase